MLELDGHWVFGWGVDDSDRSVGGTACLSTLGLLEFVSLYHSLSCDSKSFAAGKALLRHFGCRAGDKSLAARRAPSSNSSREV
jgi:hypothetical protein